MNSEAKIAILTNWWLYNSGLESIDGESFSEKDKRAIRLYCDAIRDLFGSLGFDRPEVLHEYTALSNVYWKLRDVYVAFRKMEEKGKVDSKVLIDVLQKLMITAINSNWIPKSGDKYAVGYRRSYYAVIRREAALTAELEEAELFGTIVEVEAVKHIFKEEFDKEPYVYVIKCKCGEHGEKFNDKTWEDIIKPEDNSGGSLHPLHLN